MTIRCEIVSQDRIVYQGEAQMVNLPGADGEMGILPNHSPLLTLLQFGVIDVKTSTGYLHFTVSGGVVEVQPDQVTILADAAENVEEIDIARAEAAKARAESLMKTTPQMDAERYESLKAALQKSNLRIDAARRYRQSKSMSK
jgi:F-type H+-transporting ATPase subunit epsilon